MVRITRTPTKRLGTQALFHYQAYITRQRYSLSTLHRTPIVSNQCKDHKFKGSDVNRIFTDGKAATKNSATFWSSTQLGGKSIFCCLCWRKNQWKLLGSCRPNCIAKGRKTTVKTCGNQNNSVSAMQTSVSTRYTRITSPIPGGCLCCLPHWGHWRSIW